MEHALKHLLAGEERTPRDPKPEPRLGLGTSTDDLSAVETTAEPVAREVK